MKAWEYRAVAYDGDVFCVECLPQGVPEDSPEVGPIFADQEWDYTPVCAICGTTHDYVTVLGCDD